MKQKCEIAITKDERENTKRKTKREKGNRAEGKKERNKENERVMRLVTLFLEYKKIRTNTHTHTHITKSYTGNSTHISSRSSSRSSSSRSNSMQKKKKKHQYHLICQASSHISFRFNGYITFSCYQPHLLPPPKKEKEIHEIQPQRKTFKIS